MKSFGKHSAVNKLAVRTSQMSHPAESILCCKLQLVKISISGAPQDTHLILLDREAVLHGGLKAPPLLANLTDYPHCPKRAHTTPLHLFRTQGSQHISGEGGCDTQSSVHISNQFGCVSLIFEVTLFWSIFLRQKPGCTRCVPDSAHSKTYTEEETADATMI